jgi:alanyl-tRNA synthetase
MRQHQDSTRTAPGQHPYLLFSHLGRMQIDHTTNTHTHTQTHNAAFPKHCPTHCDLQVSIAVAFSPGVVSSGLAAGKFVGGIAKICGGSGGGRPNLAQAGGKDSSKLDDALEEAMRQLEAAL